MEIATQPGGTGALAPQPASQTGAETAKPVISSDFETFLQMLTTQMQNQDPLNPIESTDFATQLATFSSVEQQVLTNDLLTTLGSQLGALSVAQLSGWVGMEARAVMPVIFAGQPVDITTQPVAGADKSMLVVRDVNGAEMQRFQIDTGRQELTWAGVADNGTPLPDGEYNLSVESFQQGELIATEPVSVSARIVEARNDNGRPTLVMESGQIVESGDILGLKEAD